MSFEKLAVELASRSAHPADGKLGHGPEGHHGAPMRTLWQRLPQLETINVRAALLGCS